MMRKNILIITPARLGDTVFITPSIRLLKFIDPEAIIDVIAITKLAGEVLAGNPYVRNLFVEPTMGELASYRNAYDVKINIHDSERARQYLAMFEAKQLTYYFDKSIGYLPRAQQMIIFFAKLSSYDLGQFDMHYDLCANAEHHASLQQKLETYLRDYDKHTLVGLHLGCHGLAKKRSRFWGRFSHEKAWPIKNFIKLAKELNKKHPGIYFVLTGSNAEEPLAEEFSKHIPNSINLINKISVLELTALMYYLKLFITNDTGALHVAASTDVNLIALFGPSDEKLHGPFPKCKKQTILKKIPIKKITVDEVMNLAMKYL